MALEDDINTLSSVALFEAFTRDQLRLLAFGAERLVFAKGSDIFHEGEPADCAYVVTLGRIALVREDDDGRQETIRTVRSGAILGELALISSTSRLTGAVAESDVEVIRLGRGPFHRILEEYPELALALHERITEQFSDLIGRIERLSKHFDV